MPAVITNSSVLCAGGRGTEQLWATVRAGISCIRNSHVVDKNFDAIQMGLVPDDQLEPLPPEVEKLALPPGPSRMLQLAGPTLAAIASAADPAPLTVYLGLPRLPPDPAPWLTQFLQLLGKVAGVPVDSGTSRTFPFGRAAALLALEAALAQIAQDPAATIVVGGVDSFLDLRRIADLDGEDRILGPRIMDGFIPGEGAAFFMVKDAGTAPLSPIGLDAKILAATSIADEGHRYGTAPNLGVGLADALEKLRGLLPPDAARVGCTMAALNGENYEAKLWGVARLRHNELFLPDMVMRHPADCVGDTGAASGAILTSLGAHALSKGQISGSALVWAASDHEPRASAMLSA